MDYVQPYGPKTLPKQIVLLGKFVQVYHLLDLYVFLHYSGTVWVNCWLIRDLNMPFGGMKQSGLGRESGHDSEEFFTEPQCIATLH